MVNGSFIFIVPTNKILKHTYRRQRQMCIRDSSEGVNSRARTNGDILESGYRRSFFKNVCVWGAVSYTHLRAHET